MQPEDLFTFLFVCRVMTSSHGWIKTFTLFAFRGALNIWDVVSEV